MRELTCEELDLAAGGIASAYAPTLGGSVALLGMGIATVAAAPAVATLLLAGSIGMSIGAIYWGTRRQEK